MKFIQNQILNTESNNMKVVDAFTFNNEIDLLLFRFHELNDIVDHFVIVESKQTFTGNTKPLYFTQHADLFQPFMHKVTNVIIEEFPNNIGNWDREYYQRNQIRTGVMQLDLTDEDIVMFGDADEIPDSETLQQLKQSGLSGIHQFCQHLYYYNIKNRCMATDWFGHKIMPYRNFLQVDDLHKCRISYCPVIEKGGWHLSYFGGVEFIVKKIQDFSHQELNNSNYINDNLHTLVSEGKDLFHRAEMIFEHIEPENNTYLPKNYTMLIK
jgi:beta-1,4-mannosyl-glycoprotein beta-1,4-N-acetylglucosaminyltransferase